MVGSSFFEITDICIRVFVYETQLKNPDIVSIDDLGQNSVREKNIKEKNVRKIKLEKFKREKNI